MNRRDLIQGAAAGAVALAVPARLRAASAAPSGFGPVLDQVGKAHEESVKRLQEWIRQPSIAAENRGMKEGCELMIRMLKDAGFGRAERIETDGQPGVFAVLDAGAPRTVGVYFMYDVKQADPSEWSSPPWDAAVVDRPGMGKVLVGRGAVNQKGPEATFLAALHAFRAAGRKLPVNLVLVAEGEEEIGSPHFSQIVRKPEIREALARCTGVFMPFASQGPDGLVTVNLGGKGVVELELVSTGERWGRGPRADLHSSNKARVDSPVWHLVQALSTLVSPDGNTPAVDNFADRARPLSAADKALIAAGAKRMDEGLLKKQMTVEHWVHDESFGDSLERLVSQPTINIEGIVGGYTGPGGKTILPHKALAKLDMRLVPDMKALEALDALKKHLAKRGYGDIEVNMTGGYDPTTTPADAALIRSELAVYRRSGIDPILWPRLAGSWPGYVFTGDPLKLPAGHFGLGHGNGAHAPNEYYLIESSDPKIQGMDGAARSYVEFLGQLATES